MPDPNTDQRPVPLPAHPPALSPPVRPWGMDENVFCTLLHLSPFTPGVGFILTLVMWLTQKNESPRVDAHGRAVMNWVLSAMIYFFVSFVLMFVLIGFLTFFATAICTLVFLIVGAVKASNGQVWNYPLSIPFFGRPDPAVERGGPALPPPDDMAYRESKRSPGEGF